ncbi:MAG: magnesium transporter [Ignavibacteriales bacterium CG12_big_fil_rev_8_21_14_0_65_30_8]|nr:MAG: magnesium transporter [Ignavibacteriales bacterium CG12_big_fil_rev_8_21_14_0_65_30_8]
MLSKLLKPEIKDLLNEKNLSTLKEVLNDWTPADLANLIEETSEKDRVILFRLLHKDLATDTFEFIEVEQQIELIKAMGNKEIAAILNEMAPDDRTALFEELPSSAVKQFVTLLSHEERIIAQTLLGYPEDSVGRLMTPDYIAVNPNWTVSESIKYIRENGKDSETLNIIFIVDEKGKLIDDLKIRELILAEPDKKINDLMDKNFVALHVTDDQEKAVVVFKEYDRIALPVIDNKGVLLGLVTVDDVLDVAEEEATEDMQKIGGLTALEESYSKISIFQMMKKRAGWLSLLFIGELLTASAMGFFENEIGKALILVLFVPLIISSGGNSGSQASTLVIRALSVGEIKLKDWFFVMKREIISGIILGSILAILGFLRIFVWKSFSDIFGIHWFLLALTVSVSLLGVVLWGTLAGSMLPIILKKLGADPAVSSAPLVATLVDVTGLVIYFSVAILFLSGTLL